MELEEFEEFEKLFGNIPINDFKNIKEYINKNFVSKDDLKNFFGERLFKYQEADDGKYDKPYLTRGKLELVDRYGECKDIAEILLKEKIEFPKECVSKDIIREKINERQFELQQEYKDFKDDIRLNTLQEIYYINEEDKQ